MIYNVCMGQALNKEQRWGSALLSRHQSLEEEFERAKAAVEVSTAPPHAHGEASQRPLMMHDSKSWIGLFAAEAILRSHFNHPAKFTHSSGSSV